MISAEKRLQELENEIKALKATYTISGGAMKTYLSYSDEYVITDIITESPFKIKFVSQYSDTKDILVTSFFVSQTSGEFEYNLSQWSVIVEQSGDGTVTFEIPLLIAVDTVRVGVASTVPGTFTRV